LTPSGVCVASTACGARSRPERVSSTTSWSVSSIP
jgi:hypothetical protein